MANWRRHNHKGSLLVLVRATSPDERTLTVVNLRGVVDLLGESVRQVRESGRATAGGLRLVLPFAESCYYHYSS